MMANVYRVYVTRHYIAVKFYDIEAESEEKAGSLARKTVRKQLPDVRQTATDNLWQLDSVTEIPHVGHSSVGMSMSLVNNTKQGTVWEYDDETG
jgi:hypothetical protein